MSLKAILKQAKALSKALIERDAAEALAAEMKGELDGLTQELYDSKHLAASRGNTVERLRDVIWKLEKQMDELGKVSADQKKLLRRAHAMLEIGMPYLIELIEEIAEELGDD